MPGLKVVEFGGIAPLINPRRLPNEMAVAAANVVLDSGAIDPLRVDAPEGAVDGIGSATRTIFRLAPGKWAAWSEDVDVALSPIAEDPSNRIYWTGSDYPRMADLATAIAGTTYPTNSYRLGIPAPDTNVSASVTGGTAIDGAEPEERSYVFTYISAYGEQGPPSAASVSEIIEVTEGEEVTVTFPGVPTGNYNLVGKRLYRTDDNGTFRFVAELALAASSYVDTTLDKNLGEALPSSGWEAPPDEVSADHPDGPMLGLLMLSDGSMCGFSGKTLLFSEQNLPHAFPREYRLTLEHEIVATAEIDGGVLVGTTERPYIVSGSSPASRLPTPIDEPLGCVSKRSMVDMGGYAIYASPQGLIAVSSSGAQNLTEKLLSREQWQAYAPASIHAYLWEGKYLAFWDDGATQGGFIFDPRGGKNALVPVDFYAQCGWLDRETGVLYLVVNGSLVRFDQGGTRRTAVWRSKLFRAQKPMCPGVGKVAADVYPLTFQLWADGVLKHTQTVQSEEFFRLPGGYKAREFQVEVSGVAGRVYEIAAFTSPAEG